MSISEEDQVSSNSEDSVSNATTLQKISEIIEEILMDNLNVEINTSERKYFKFYISPRKYPSNFLLQEKAELRRHSLLRTYSEVYELGRFNPYFGSYLHRPIHKQHAYSAEYNECP